MGKRTSTYCCYHSIFLQSYGLDVFIPSTPKEAFQHNIYMNSLNHPSVMLEHRYLTQIKENFNLKQKIKKPSHSKLYKSKIKKIKNTTHYLCRYTNRPLKAKKS